MKIRVMHVGLGPIGAAVATQLAARKGFRIVGAVDIDPHKVGRDLGTLLDAKRPLRIAVTESIGRTIAATRPDVVVLCTGSTMKGVLPQIEEVLARRVPIVTTTEQMAYPSRANRALARRIDAAARKAKVAVLGTGVNPGFTMDMLPIVLTSACATIDRIDVERVQDARARRLPFQQKIGAGLTREQFVTQVERGTVRHVGFAESIQMIADAVGWRLERITDEILPKIAETAVHSELLAVDAGYVCGIIQSGTGWVDGTPKIRLRLEAYLGAADPYDAVLIEGTPRIYSRIEGGVHGDIATASLVINAIPAVLAAAPGLRTMRDLRLPSFYGG